MHNFWDLHGRWLSSFHTCKKLLCMTLVEKPESWLRCCLSFSLLRSWIQCIHGQCLLCHQSLCKDPYKLVWGGPSVHHLVLGVVVPLNRLFIYLCFIIALVYGQQVPMTMKHTYKIHVETLSTLRAVRKKGKGKKGSCNMHLNNELCTDKYGHTYWILCCMGPTDCLLTWPMRNNNESWIMCTKMEAQHQLQLLKEKKMNLTFQRISFFVLKRGAWWYILY